MEIIKQYNDGITVLKLQSFSDSRGYFFETYKKEKYAELGITASFVQDNISKSAKNTLRGLHYQIPPRAQGKLCQVLAGTALDVAVDIRRNSPDYGKVFYTELSEENKYQIYIPPGFAHGFVALTDGVIFSYKCTDIYSKIHERTILFNDPRLDIDWRTESPLVSDKDLQGVLFKDAEVDFQW